MSNDPTGIQNNLHIVVCKNAEDAIAKGYNYNRPEHKAARLLTCVVVKNGTVRGNSTVDFIFEDETGQKHVVMLTGALIKSIPC